MRFSFGKPAGEFPAEIHTRNAVFNITRDFGLFIGPFFVGVMLTLWRPESISALAPRVTAPKPAVVSPP